MALMTGEHALTGRNAVCHCYAVHLVTSGPYSTEDNTVEAQQQRPRIFYGWVIVAAASMIVAISMGLMFSLGVFMEPLETAFGWGRGQIAQGILYGWLMYGTFSLVFGALSDRFGMQRIIMVGGLMFGCGMLAQCDASVRHGHA